MLGGAGNDQIEIDVHGSAYVGASGGSGGYSYGSFTYALSGGSGSGGSLTIQIQNNLLSGGDGDDTLSLALSVTGNAAVTIDIHGNVFDGGADHDTLDFSALIVGSGVSLDLAAGSLIIAGGVNTVSNIEEVIGTQYNDYMAGSIASETFNGGGGADTMIGGIGNDTLTGGIGSDTFIFRAGFGLDTITDFVAGAGSGDVIQFADDVFADFASVLAAATQVGADTVIAHDGSNTLTLKNVAVASLHQDDFQFIAA
ncbi:hypothetical protein [Mesorhizobium sp. B2-4-14]|uniref:calcium-binding protein n=1 Tax=Mesorhizobium sp. B2-4-14 TaxID=2589935 RepID=UPI0015E41916|nr:hypothetical protein [Mesorhizobium sp. B2-4-14]